MIYAPFTFWFRDEPITANKVELDAAIENVTDIIFELHAGHTTPTEQPSTSPGLVGVSTFF